MGNNTQYDIETIIVIMITIIVTVSIMTGITFVIIIVMLTRTPIAKLILAMLLK